MVDDLFGWKDHQLRFGQVQLKVVIFHVDISARQSEIRAETVVSSGGKDRNS